MRYVDDERLTTMGLFVEAYGGLAAKASEQLAMHGLDMAQFDVLLRLARSPGQRLRMSDLAAQTQTTMSLSGITRVVDRLERAGLVERVACSSDRRGFFATLTAVGEARLEAVLPGHLAVVDEWLTALLPPAQLRALVSALRTVRDAVRPGATAGAERTDVPASRRGSPGPAP